MVLIWCADEILIFDLSSMKIKSKHYSMTHVSGWKTMLFIHTAADRLPPVLHAVVTSPRLAIGGVLVFCSVLNLTIILPCYIASLVVTEIGLYLSILISIWCIGRWVIRLLAFPGSTHRVYNDIEIEFGDGSIKTYVSGNFLIKNDVTR